MDNRVQQRPPPGAAVYARTFLTASATFIYRQTLGVSEAFRPFVLTNELQHQDAFPMEHSVFRRREITFGERVYCKFVRFITGRYSQLPPSQLRAWEVILKEQQARLIHAHFGPGGLDLLPLAKAAGLPLLVSFHGHDASALLQHSRYVSHLRDLFRYAHIITVSRSMADRLLAIGAPQDRTHVLHYGIPLEHFPYKERMPPRQKRLLGKQLCFLQVSNFVEKKGHVYTVHAFRELLRTAPACRLILVGDGPLRSSIQDLCRALGIQEKVLFTGHLSNYEVSPFMTDADVFLHHSVTATDGDQEGIPNAIMEAMATGLVPISTIHSGIPELIKDRVNGFLVPERDVSMYMAMMRAALSCGRDIGLKAHETIKADFNLTTQNRRLIDIYMKAIAND